MCFVMMEAKLRLFFCYHLLISKLLIIVFLTFDQVLIWIESQQ